MTFWPWALQAYARDGVAEGCLDLQDRHGQSVPYLLWAAWAAQTGRALSASDLQAGASLAARWEAAAVGPLRRARRGLKPAFEGISDAAREQLRGEVKALELKAEQALMLALESLTPAPSGQSCPVNDALRAAVAAWTSPAPDAALARLAEALG
jgi:uncharacterized protein (TIGR02444 family)